MSWNTTAPDGSQSVKANESILQTNTTYTKTEMNKDHYWDTSANQNGHHTKVEMDKQSSDPAISAGMDGVFYVKDTANSPRSEAWYRNSDGIYQFMPSVKKGTVAIASGSTFSIVASVPINTYGEIFMYQTALGIYTGQTGFFRSDGTSCEAWSYGMKIQGVTAIQASLKFGNGSDVSGLNIMARRDKAASKTWNYIITYRDQ